MGFFKQRTTPLAVLITQVWDRQASSSSVYRTNYLGYTWPAIDLVPASGSVPSHGLFHGPEGDIVINHGDYISLRPATGRVSASSWYNFVGFYEEVLNVPN